MDFHLLRNRNFISYALGQGISNLGSLMTYYALSFYVLNNTKSPSTFAFVLSVKYIPQIFLYPFAGVIVDKINRKKLLIFFDGIRGIFLLILVAIIYKTGIVDLTIIYSIVFISAIIEAFYNPATVTIIPLLFIEKDYIIANSFNSWIQNLSLLIGPIFGALIYSSFGIKVVLICDTTSFFIVMVLTMFQIFKETNPIKKKIIIFKDFLQGVILTLKNTDLLFAVLGIGVSRVFINPFYTIGLPFLIIKLFNASLSALSIIQSFIIVGTLISPILVIFLAKYFRDTTSLMISRMGKILPFTLLLAILSNNFFQYLKMNTTSLVIYFSAVCFLGSMFNSSGFTFINSYFQRRVPKEYLGRFASIRFMFYSIVEPIGINFFGLLYGKVEMVYPIILVLIGAIIEAILLSYMALGETSCMDFRNEM